MDCNDQGIVTRIAPDISVFHDLRLHDAVSAHMVQTGWLHAAVTCLGRLSVADGGSKGSKDSSNMQKKLTKGESWRSLSKAKDMGSGDGGGWEKVRCAMSALRLLATLTSSPSLGCASVWGEVGWRTVVKNVESGGLMRLGAGYTVIGMLLEMSLEGSNKVCFLLLCDGNNLRLPSRLKRN